MLNSVLETAIVVNNTRDCNENDLLKLAQSKILIDKALQDFIHGFLGWEEYLDLLEMHQINMDGYLDIVDNNLSHFELI